MECTRCQGHTMGFIPTPQQRRALAYASAGYTNKETTEAMGVSLDWVENLLEMARNALGARNTKHAIAIAYAHHVLPIEGVNI